ncbi:MAG: hypothetical protein ABI443_12175, partial [Chthoniobacterales bacterium]
VIYFPQDAYPSEECIRSAYEEELRKLGEEMVQFETARGWLRGSPDVNFAAYDREGGRLRTLYILNIANWSDERAANVTFLFKENEYPIAARNGAIEVITVSQSIAVMPDSQDMDVMDIQEEEGKFRIMLQSDKGGNLSIFSPRYPQIPKSITVDKGGIQEVILSLS